MKTFKDAFSKGSLKVFFLDHNLLHYASSLSFHTILALIPILLISLYLFTKLPIFGAYYGLMKDFIFSTLLPAHHESVSQLIDTFLSNTSSLGIIGVIFVFYVSLMFFDDFEYVINQIFKRAPRGFFLSISIYLIFILTIPLGLILSIFLSIKANILIHQYGNLQAFDFLGLTSYLIFWALFCIIYYISPNAKVHLKSALISSFIASLIWYGSKMLFVTYITFNKTYTTIYGSFSTVMFFFIWIYLSWIIFLFGAKLCYLLNKQKEKKIESQKYGESAFLKNPHERDQ